jgi:hypothetical protein
VWNASTITAEDGDIWYVDGPVSLNIMYRNQMLTDIIFDWFNIVGGGQLFSSGHLKRYDM